MASNKGWQKEMKGVLDTLHRNGTFAVGKRIDLPPLYPKITVDGMMRGSDDERLAFPLPAFQASLLRSAADSSCAFGSVGVITNENSPYGTSNRSASAWHIAARRIHLVEDDTWRATLSSTVRELANVMGVSDGTNVRGCLSGMLLYEPQSGGGPPPSINNRNRERAAMAERQPDAVSMKFATLVIQLPSKHSGGAMVVRHLDRAETFDFSGEESREASFATAFYSDCDHETAPVTEGWRLCLVFDLEVTDNDRDCRGSTGGFFVVPTAGALATRIQKLQSLASRWLHACGGTPQWRGYLLDDKYDPTDLHFRDLKSRDREVVDFLRTVRDDDGRPLFVVFLLLMEQCVYPAMGSHSSYRHWVGPDDEVLKDAIRSFDPEASLLVDEEEDVQDIFHSKPDKIVQSKDTSSRPSVGAQYWYYRGAVVFWPRSVNLAVAGQAGLPFLLSYLRSASSPPQSSESVAIGAKAVERVEKHGESVTAELLNSLMGIRNEALMARAVKQVNSIVNDAMVKALATVAIKFEAYASVRSAVLGLLSEGSKFKGEMPFKFVGILERDAPFEVAQAAREALVEGALAQNILGSKDEHRVCNRIADIAFKCNASLFERFVDATIRYGNSERVGSVLTTLTGTFGAPAVGEDRNVRRLYREYVRHLKHETRNGRPVFSWRQPNANFRGSHTDAVNAFLRGDAEEETFQGGFNGITHARNWANRYFHKGCLRLGYSAEAYAGGRGANAHVTVIKNRGWYAQELQRYETNFEKLKRLTNTFEGGGTDRTCSAELSSAEISKATTATTVVVTPGREARATATAKRSAAVVGIGDNDPRSAVTPGGEGEEDEEEVGGGVKENPYKRSKPSPVVTENPYE